MNEELDIEEVAPWLVLIITLIGAGLRILLLDKQGMWLDETFSVWLANHSVADMLHWIARIDQHPPLYYLLLHYWVALNGDTPYTVRLLSVLFGAGTIPVIYLIGKRMSGAVMGLTAAVLLAFSPFNIRFAQETRMYTLLAFNAAVAIYALVRLLTDPRSLRPIGSQFREYLHAWRTPGPVELQAGGDLSATQKTRHRWLPIHAIETDLAWVAFIVFSAATLLSHNTAVLFLFAVNLFVLGLLLLQRRKSSAPLPGFQAPSFWNWVKAQIGIFLLWSPWLFAFIGQVYQVYREFWIPRPTWEAITRALGTFLNAATLARTSPERALWVVYGLVLCLGMWHYREKMAHFFFLAALFAVPFLGELLVSLQRPIFYDRTLIWITIPLFLLLAAGVAQLRFRFLIIAVLGILATNNMFAASDYFRFTQKEDWSTAAGYVANFAEEQDLVLFNASWTQIPFDYYFKSYEDLYSIRVEKHGLPVDMFTDGVLEPKMTADDIPALLALINGRHRVWLVYSHDSYTDPLGLIPQTLASQMTLTRVRDFYGGQVQLYEAP